MQQEDTKPIDGISLMEYQEPYMGRKGKGEGEAGIPFGVTREVRDGPSTDYILHKRKPTSFVMASSPKEGTDIYGGFPMSTCVYPTRSNVPLAIGFTY
ncbi:uncharacterized protein ARB_07015 [Trichophyton benhamiae CBS 112371]|uniref:Uncharacterized protein n=1 Tax=Arthroderma benhamiae (strain ATCC MYA-4681 / CBS 112371) TaxID=663331 RepID=D4AS00_ARTBC|nr:uncharacterized protein ARB_07015 [Trichophyton benhamiae CBS 112371]EFE34064.1 hypothetical protein ARB_07015 [Trichophyton benhamiae CBS 112371]